MGVKEKELSRRRFIKSAGATLAVTALSTGVGGLLTGCSKPEEETTGGANGQPVEVTWPLGYKPLDPDKAEEMAYNSYKAGNGCAQGVADALLGLAAEEYGAPYSYIPPQMFNVGKGGIVGWGASCGALLGAVFFIGLVAPQEDQAAIVNELMAWYQQASFPYYKPSDMELSKLWLIPPSVTSRSPDFYRKTTSKQTRRKKPNAAAVLAEMLPGRLLNCSTLMLIISLLLFTNHKVPRPTTCQQ